MTTISIREFGSSAATAAGPVVAIDGPEYPITITDPYEERQETDLEWYFEEHLRFPFTDEVKAKRAAASIQDYGERLWRQIFADPEALVEYRTALAAGIETLTIEIAGSPAFHALHWEALKDPKLAQPLALQATFVRRNLKPQPIKARLRPSPTINILLVTARPGGAYDVGYRTIARPLIELLRKSTLRVQVHILRPGSYKSLADHLAAVRERHGTGHYHIVHFDVHGGLLSYKEFDAIERGLPTNRFTYQMARFGRPKMDAYEGVKAFLFLEHEQESHADPVEATELADLLQLHGIPIALLNACQSGKQVGDQETSLGSQLLLAGVQMTLAMGYSVTVSAAELLMETLYKRLYAGASLAAAIRSARQALYGEKRRRAYYNQEVELEDWLLPVVYENRPQQLKTRDFTNEEEIAHARALAAAFKQPKVAYRFVGRDLDVLQIERRLLHRDRNVLLVRGMGGAGKTTLLRHLAWWWQTTDFVDQVFYYGYDERAWSRQQIMDGVARLLLGEAGYVARFQSLPDEGLKEVFLAEQLRGTRHLLILDNLESITGTHLAIRNTLPEEERIRVHSFLQALAGGRTVVLLGSRSDEAWLAPGTFDDNVYDLPGLDPEAASALADLVLTRHDATRHRDDDNFDRLLKLLDGYPLPIEVVLANLAQQTPGEVIEALEAGEALEQADEDGDLMEAKTRSILRCIDYSHGNLAEEDQELLLCLAPFTGIINLNWWEQYTDQLKRQEDIADLPYERWNEVLKAAIGWGLLTSHTQIQDAARPQPIFPYFLRSRLENRERIRQAIENAFREHYDGLSGAIYQLLTSRESRQKQVGYSLATLEFENLMTALRFALSERVPFFTIYNVLEEYLDLSQDHVRRLRLGEMVWASQAEYLKYEDIKLQQAQEFALVLDRLGHANLALKNYEFARTNYTDELALLDALTFLEPEGKKKLQAGTYHQLGRVAQEQRQWEQAEQYYQQALAITIEFNDRFSQASTYHNLGSVAQEQRQWEQAEQYYQQALAIYIEFNDRFSQASTYHNLGRVAQEQRQWEQAEQYYQQALAIYIEFNDRFSQASTYHNLGIVAQEQRQWEQAEQYYQQALAIYIEFNDRFSQASTYHNLGIVAQEQRQWEQAEQYYQQALAIYIEFNDRFSQASTYHQLGIVAQEQRQWEQAEQYYQQALAIKIEFNDRFSQASTYHQLGSVAQEQRQWEQAEQYYQQALAIKIEFNDRFSQASTYHQLGRVAQEQRQWEQAEQYYQQALAIKIEFNDRFSQASTYHQLGRVAQEQRQWEQAEQYLLKDLEITLAYNDQHGLGITLRTLARLWQESGRDALIPAVAVLVGAGEDETRKRLKATLGDEEE